jgi:hypothetical protein
MRKLKEVKEIIGDRILECVECGHREKPESFSLVLASGLCSKCGGVMPAGLQGYKI